jgi:hypothetical protein
MTSHRNIVLAGSADPTRCSPKKGGGLLPASRLRSTRLTNARLGPREKRCRGRFHDTEFNIPGRHAGAPVTPNAPATVNGDSNGVGNPDHAELVLSYAHHLLGLALRCGARVFDCSNQKNHDRMSVVKHPCGLETG